jgi:hypothetical protein
VLKLLTRLYDADGGAVRVNGLDVKNLTLEVGVVLLTHDGVCTVAHIVVPHIVDDDVCTSTKNMVVF